MAPPEPGLRFVCRLHVALSAPHELGSARTGGRRIIPIIGGHVEGPELSGTILPVGADWQVVHDASFATLDARYAFETPDGALIEVVNTGYRHGPPEVLARLARGEPVDPTEYSMRTTARLETGAPAYEWVNRTVFVGSGARLPDAVEIALYAVD